MAYEAVFLDLGGVVLDFDADRLVHQVSQLIHRPFEEVHRAVYQDEFLLPLELGQIEPRAYYEHLHQTLALPWTYERFVRAWNDIFTENRAVTRLMQQLRAHHTLVALSNTNQLHIDHIRQTIPSLTVFSHWVASCEVGLRKPDPAIYRLALHRAAVKAEAAVYVDDRPELVEAGRAEGLTAIRFCGSRQLEQELRNLGLRLDGS